MKPTNFFSKITIAVMVFMIFTTTLLQYASASTAEQKFLFPFKSYSEIPTNNFYKNMHTTPTYKENESPMYINCTEITTYMSVTAVGVDENGNLFTSTSGESYSYMVYNGQKRFIKNTVKQDGYQYGAIVSVGSFKAKGFWSVDSVIGEEGVFSEEDYLQPGKPINTSPSP